MLEGAYEFLVEGRTLRAGTGSLLYVPRDNLHAHRNAGEGLGRMLVTQTPGGLYELFFEKMGEAGPLVVKEQPDVGRIVEVADECGIEIPPPIAG